LLHQRKPSRAVNLPLEDVPLVLASYWFDAPASWFVNPPHGIRTEALALTGQCDLPQALVPLQSFTRGRGAKGATLSRGFLSPQRHPFTKSYHSQALPARVMLRPRTYHVPRRFAPLANSLVSFQPGALSGHCLQSLTRRRSPVLLSPTSPLAISTLEPRKQTSKPTYGSTSPELTARRLFIERVRRLVPPGSVVPNRATSAQGIAACAASLQGFNPFAGWRRRFRISPSTTFLALLAFTLLGVLPFPSPEPRGRRARLFRARRHDPTAPSDVAAFRDCAELLPLRHFGRGPVLGPDPYASEFQRARKLALPLPRLPAP